LQILPNSLSNCMCATVCMMVELVVDKHVDTNRVGESTAAISTLFSLKLFEAVFELLPDLNDVVLKVLVALPDEDIRITAFEKLFEHRTNCLEVAERLINHIDLRNFANMNTHVVCRPGIFIATPLTIAVYWKNFPLCRKLIAAGADVDGFIIDPETKEKKRGRNFRSPVTVAARNNDLKMVDFFIKKCGADYKLVDRHGFDVMTSVVSSFDRADGDHRLIDYLLNLDPKHFRKMITADKLQKCIFSGDDRPVLRVKKLGPITSSYLAGKSDARSVFVTSSSASAPHEQQQCSSSIVQRGSALVSASAKKQEKQKASDLEKGNQQRSPFKQLFFNSTNRNTNEGAAS
jgi:hypothetical protein